jgi:hypothetical protein
MTRPYAVHIFTAITCHIIAVITSVRDAAHRRYNMTSIGSLKGALFANTVFSGVTGITALVLARPLSESLGPPEWSLRTLGVGLLVFAGLVAREARAPGRPGTWQIIAADLAWVTSAAIAVAVGPGWMTGAGRVVLAAVTVPVAVLAAWQWRGLEAAS